MSTAKNSDVTETAQHPDTPKILVKTRLKGKEAQVHRVQLNKSETRSYTGLLTHALYGRAKKDYKAVMVIRKGLPASSFSHMVKSLNTTESYLLPIVGISDRTWQRRQKEKKPFDLVESDRLYRLAKVYARAIEVFEDEAVALDWLKSKNRALGDVPLMLLDTEAGTDMVERVLTRIEHGVYS